MTNYKCTLSYDGSLFSGWAIQNNVKTIQETIQNELSILFNQKINIFASGRTDKYVHALNQVFSFKAKLNLDPQIIQNVINNKLNKNGILIHSVEIMDQNFHARFSTKSKTYKYVINRKGFSLFERNYIYQYDKKVNISKIKKIIPLFVGTHNFLSFSTSELENNVRTINFIKIKKTRKTIEIYINGDGFLRNMVRMIVATFLKFNEDNITMEEIKQLFDNPRKGGAINKLPGCGLYLEKVFY